MSKEKEYTAQQAAIELKISDSRVRQLALAGEIEHKYFGRALVITQNGIEQARKRETTVGRKKLNKAA